MPLYTVRYRNDQELTFTSAGILREQQIVERLLAHEQIAPQAEHDWKEILATNNLTPVLYTEDESEPITIA